MVEDYVPDRLEFDRRQPRPRQIKPDAPAKLRRRWPLPLRRAGVGADLEGEVLVAPADRAAGLCRLSVRHCRRGGSASNERTPLEDLPETDAKGAASFNVTLDKPPASTRPQEAQIFIRMAEAGGRAVERKLVLPVAPAAPMIGVKPLFAETSPEGDKAAFDVVMAAPDGSTDRAQRAALRTAQARTRATNGIARARRGITSRSNRRAASPMAISTLKADAPARLTLQPEPGRYRLDVRTADADGPLTSVQFDVGWYSDGSADTPDLLETSIDKPDYLAGDTMTVDRQFAQRRAVDRQRNRRSSSDHADGAGEGGRVAGQNSGRPRLGHRRLRRRDAASSARCGGAADAGPRPGREVVRHRPHRAHALGRPDSAAAGAARHRFEASRSRSAG